MTNFQSTPTFVGRSLWSRSCGGLNCSRRATARWGIDTLIANILLKFDFFEKTGNQISFAAVGPREHYIRRGPDPHAKGAIIGEKTYTRPS